MRTTVTIDPDVAVLLREETDRSRLPFKQVLNQAVRRGLAPVQQASPVRVVTRPHDFEFKPGIDLDRLNQLVDELDADAERNRFEALQ